jgi:outer membrane receptor protein involved in Fe transport
MTQAPTALSDDKSEIESILSEHVVTTASATTQRASVAPALSTTITADDIRHLGIRSIAEAIDFLSLGVVTGDPLRAPDIGSRGVLFGGDDGKHFLLLLNGHAINDPLYGAARFDQGAGVPIDMVDHIEVMLGPGSVLYGSNAMMGVINIITKSTSDYQGAHVLGDLEIGRSYRAGAGVGTSFRLFGASSELTAGFEYYDRYGPQLTFPQQTSHVVGLGAGYTMLELGKGLPLNTWGGAVNSAYFVQAPSALVRFRSGDFEVNLLASTYRRGIPYSSAIENVEFDDSESFEMDRSLRADIKHTATLSALAQLTSRAYADSFDYQRHLDNSGTVGCLTSTIAFCRYADAGVAQWVGLEERITLNWLQDQSLVTMVGVDGRARWVGAKQDMVDAATGRAIGPTAGRISETGGVVSPYLQQTYQPTTWLDLNAGARLDVDNRYSPVISPRGALAVRPAQKTTLKAIYSQAFRAPTYSETDIVDYTVAPSPGLQPETVRSLEGSIEQQLGTQRLVFGVFRTWWQNLVEPAPITSAQQTKEQMEGKLALVSGNQIQYSNVANIDNYGWNGGWEGSALERRLRFAANATGAFTRIVQGSVSAYPPLAPQIFGNAHVTYLLGPSLPVATVAVFGLGPRAADRTAPNGATLPAAPAVADVRVALTGRVPSLRAIGYAVTAHYATAGYGPYTTGTSFPFEQVFLATGATLPTPGYAPIDQFRVMVGLRFDFLEGSRASSAGEVQ